MKTLIFILLSIPLFAQQKEFPDNSAFVYGITMVETIHFEPKIVILGQSIKGDAYVDIKIHIANERIINPVFIETNKGQFTIPIYTINKSGYSILRLFFRLKEQWVSIDSGINFIIVKTDKKTYRIVVNNNLNKLKTYALNK